VNKTVLKHVAKSEPVIVSLPCFEAVPLSANNIHVLNFSLLNWRTFSDFFSTSRRLQRWALF